MLVQLRTVSTEGADVQTLREVAMFFGFLLTMFGLGALCVLAFYSLVYVVPCAIGLSAFFGVVHLGGGYLGAIVLGIICGAASFGLFQWVLETRRSDLGRWLVVAAFVVPAIIAGYGAGFDLSGLTVTSSIWQHIYAVVGAIMVGSAAFTRLMAPSDNMGDPSHSANWPASRA